MGGGNYSFSSRSARTETFKKQSVDQTFEQNVKRMIHKSMDPKDIKIREARDSENHPNSVPIILALDVTGSMGMIPAELIKDGLPHIMGHIIEHGTPDPTLLFMAIGDCASDNFPLQVGQFEAGDEELDTWLTRTYLEGNGGGNGGESYHLAWYFAANHTVTDAWEKRKQKGFLFTTGDEPCHRVLSKSMMDELMTYNTYEKPSYTTEELLARAQERYHVYHIHINHGRTLDPRWKEMLGDHCIEINDPADVAKVVADIVVKNTPKVVTVNSAEKKDSTPTPEKKTEDTPATENML